jgi:uncharacterized membrane protein
VATVAAVATERPRVAGRVAGLDVIRGVVMVLMAIDHVRVYAGIPAGGPDPGIFFTRWVTHFCAPAFAFFAGTSAFLLGLKLGDRRALARYLVTRGLMLVLLELTVIRASWTFNLDYSQFLLAGVIWMLGWCMVLLAALLWLPTLAIGVLGVLIIFFQDAFGMIGGGLPDTLRWFWEFVYPVGMELKLGADGPAINVLYCLVPWIGVMAAGYGFGAIVVREPAERRRFCLLIGISATLLFVVIASFLTFYVPRPANSRLPALFYMLNQRKYPASQLFLLMTLGPTIALLPLADRARGRIVDFFATFGRVPMFYYLLHIPLIHAVSLIVWFVRDGAIHPEWFAIAPFAQVPPSERWNLGLLYLVFIIVIALLYVPCRWYASLKARGTSAWTRYI